MRPLIIEEAYELQEAIDEKIPVDLIEELGDLFFITTFLGFLGKKEGLFDLDVVLRALNEKLIRRHPHVFGTAVIETTKELHTQWEAIKAKEKEGKKKLNLPKPMAALMRAQKQHKALKRETEGACFTSEEEAGHALYELVRRCAKGGIDAEVALQKVLSQEANALL